MENFKVTGSYEDLQLIKTIAEHYGWKYNEDFCAFSPNFSKGNCLCFIVMPCAIGPGEFSLFSENADFKAFDAVKELLPATVMIREKISRIKTPKNDSQWPKYFQWMKEDYGFWKNGHCYKIEQEGTSLMRAIDYKGEALTSVYTLNGMTEINEWSYNVWLNTWKEKVYPKYVKMIFPGAVKEDVYWIYNHCYKMIGKKDKNRFEFLNYKGDKTSSSMMSLEYISKEEYDKFIKSKKTENYYWWPEYIKLVDLGEDRIKTYNGELLKRTVKGDAKSWYGCPNPVVFYVNAYGALFGLAGYSKIQESNQKEFDSVLKVTFMFGGRKWEIENGVAIHYNENGSSYKITLEEIQASIKFITSIPESNGYNFTFDEGHTGTELKAFLMNTCNIGFGCCRGTFKKVLEFEALLNKSKK